MKNSFNINKTTNNSFYWSDGALWLSVDPLADKYPFLSPYVYGACNPVVLVDVDGRKIRGFSINSDGDIEVDYNLASPDAIRVYQAMMKTPTGRRIFKKMVKSNTEIEFEITYEKLVNKCDLQIHGKTVPEGFIYETGEYEKAKVVISLAPSDDRYKDVDEEEKINAVGVHEGVHIVNPRQRRMDFRASKREHDLCTEEGVRKYVRKYEQRPVSWELRSRLEYRRLNNNVTDNGYEGITRNYIGYLRKYWYKRAIK